jgi:hypothetical protein
MHTYLGIVLKSEHPTDLNSNARQTEKKIFFAYAEI